MRTVFFPLILEHWWVFSHSFDCNSKVFGLRDARLGGTGSATFRRYPVESAFDFRFPGASSSAI